MDSLKAVLQNLAAKELPRDSEDFCPDDVAGGNVDDGYYAGESAGQTILARELLAEFFK